MKEKVKEFLLRDWTTEEKVLLAADVLLTGVLLGWLTSPFKAGFFSNNRITTQNETVLCDELEEEE